MKFVPALLLSVIGLGSAAQAIDPLAVPAAPTPHYQQFAHEVGSFAHPASAPMRSETLFLGSSSIRLWDVADAFPAMQSVNRGFGGARVSDVLHFYREVIADTTPGAVVVYVGENDIADGIKPGQVAADVLTLLGQLRRDMPKARIVYLSMKPTPLRWELYPAMMAVNAAVRGHAGAGGFDFLDAGGALLTAEGRPDATYFGTDGLHMNARGYAVWNHMVEAYLGGEVKRPTLS